MGVPVDHMGAITDFDYQRVQKHDRPDGIQRPGLPGLDLLSDRLGDIGDGLVGQFGADSAF